MPHVSRHNYCRPRFHDTSFEPDERRLVSEVPVCFLEANLSIARFSRRWTHGISSSGSGAAFGAVRRNFIKLLQLPFLPAS
jgi:hypothetical protein